MMRDPLTTPADAYSPDADRAGQDASARPPEWLVHLLALVICFILEHMLAGRSRRSTRLPSWLHDRPDLPLASTQAEAASIRGPFGRSIAWMCRRRGIGPGHPDWPYLSRTIVAFGGSVKGARAGLPASGLLWWENPNVVPGMIGETTATPAADRNGLAAVAAGGCRRSIAGTKDHCAFRRRACTAARVPAAGLGAYRHRAADRAARYPGPTNSLMPERTGPEHGRPRRTDFVPTANPRLQSLTRHSDRLLRPVPGVQRFLRLSV